MGNIVRMGGGVNVDWLFRRSCVPAKISSVPNGVDEMVITRI